MTRPLSRRALLNAALRGHFHMFVRKVFETIQPGRDFQPAWHIDAMCEAAMTFLASEDYYLILNAPPRSLKSIVFSVALPAYLLGLDPSREIICISFAGALAEDHARHTRLVMEQEWYRELFPATRIARNPAEGIFTTRQGFRRATTVDGTLTGLGGDIFIIDDPIKPGETASDAVRQKVNRWFADTLSSRANDKRTAKTILVMQRLHIEDPSALLLERQRARHLSLPAIAQEDAVLPLPLERSRLWKAGELLDPVRLSRDVLNTFRYELGEHMYSAQFLQAPVLVDGDIIRWSWFQTYTEELRPKVTDTIIQSWDTAATDNENSDYSVCTTWMVRKDNFYLLDLFRKKLTYPDLRRWVHAHRDRYNDATVLIEDRGTGTSIAQELKRELRGVVPVKAVAEKKERAMLASIKIERGEVFLPHEASWLADFKAECLAYPNGRHDDQVDSMTHAINWWNNRPKPRCTIFSSY